VTSGDSTVVFVIHRMNEAATVSRMHGIIMVSTIVLLLLFNTPDSVVTG